ncbi:MAG: PfkB family carbohydrate kinase, partial [Candidatus Omnitrophota bacterium]
AAKLADQRDKSSSFADWLDALHQFINTELPNNNDEMARLQEGFRRLREKRPGMTVRVARDFGAPVLIFGDALYLDAIFTGIDFSSQEDPSFLVLLLTAKLAALERLPRKRPEITNDAPLRHDEDDIRAKSLVPLASASPRIMRIRALLYDIAWASAAEVETYIGYGKEKRDTIRDGFEYSLARPHGKLSSYEWGKAFTRPVVALCDLADVFEGDDNLYRIYQGFSVEALTKVAAEGCMPYYPDLDPIIGRHYVKDISGNIDRHAQQQHVATEDAKRRAELTEAIAEIVAGDEPADDSVRDLAGTIYADVRTVRYMHDALCGGESMSGRGCRIIDGQNLLGGVYKEDSQTFFRLLNHIALHVLDNLYDTVEIEGTASPAKTIEKFYIINGDGSPDDYLTGPNNLSERAREFLRSLATFDHRMKQLKASFPKEFSTEMTRLVATLEKTDDQQQLSSSVERLLLGPNTSFKKDPLGYLDMAHRYLGRYYAPDLRRSLPQDAFDDIVIKFLRGPGIGVKHEVVQQLCAMLATGMTTDKLSRLIDAFDLLTKSFMSPVFSGLALEIPQSSLNREECNIWTEALIRQHQGLPSDIDFWDMDASTSTAASPESVSMEEADVVCLTINPVCPDDRLGISVGGGGFNVGNVMKVADQAIGEDSGIKIAHIAATSNVPKWREFMERLAKKAGIDTQYFVPVLPGPIRSGRYFPFAGSDVSLLGPGTLGDESEAEKFLEAYESFVSRAPRGTLDILTGSMRRGYPPDTYLKMAVASKRVGHEVALDSYGPNVCEAVCLKLHHPELESDWGVDYAKMNIKEFREAVDHLKDLGKGFDEYLERNFGRDIRSEALEDIVLLAAHFCNATKTRYLLLTLEAGGAVLIDAEKKRAHYSPIVGNEVEKTIAAGDSALAAFLVAVRKGLSPQNALSWAMAAAGASTARWRDGLVDDPGAIKASYETLQRKLTGVPAHLLDMDLSHMLDRATPMVEDRQARQNQKEEVERQIDLYLGIDTPDEARSEAASRLDLYMTTSLKRDLEDRMALMASEDHQKVEEAIRRISIINCRASIGLELDPSGAFAHRCSGFGPRSSDLERLGSELEGAHRSLSESIKSNASAELVIPEDDDYWLGFAQKKADSMRERCADIVVIAPKALGAEAAFRALVPLGYNESREQRKVPGGGSLPPRIIFLDEGDAEDAEALARIVKEGETGVINLRAGESPVLDSIYKRISSAIGMGDSADTDLRTDIQLSTKTSPLYMLLDPRVLLPLEIARPGAIKEIYDDARRQRDLFLDSFDGPDSTRSNPHLVLSALLHELTLLGRDYTVLSVGSRKKKGLAEHASAVLNRVFLAAGANNHFLAELEPDAHHNKFAAAQGGFNRASWIQLFVEDGEELYLSSLGQAMDRNNRPYISVRAKGESGGAPMAIGGHIYMVYLVSGILSALYKVDKASASDSKEDSFKRELLKRAAAKTSTADESADAQDNYYRTKSGAIISRPFDPQSGSDNLPPEAKGAISALLSQCLDAWELLSTEWEGGMHPYIDIPQRYMDDDMLDYIIASAAYYTDPETRGRHVVMGIGGQIFPASIALEQFGDRFSALKSRPERRHVPVDIWMDTAAASLREAIALWKDTQKHADDHTTFSVGTASGRVIETLQMFHAASGAVNEQYEHAGDVSPLAKNTRLVTGWNNPLRSMARKKGIEWEPTQRQFTADRWEIVANIIFYLAMLDYNKEQIKGFLNGVAENFSCMRPQQSVIAAVGGIKRAFVSPHTQGGAINDCAGLLADESPALLYASWQLFHQQSGRDIQCFLTENSELGRWAEAMHDESFSGAGSERNVAVSANPFEDIDSLLPRLLKDTRTSYTIIG